MIGKIRILIGLVPVVEIEIEIDIWKLSWRSKARARCKLATRLVLKLSHLRLRQRILANTVSDQTPVLSCPVIPAMLQVINWISVFLFLFKKKKNIYYTDQLNYVCLFLTLVTMQAQKEAPLDMQCKDKFLVQSVIVSDATTSKDVIAEMVLFCFTFHVYHCHSPLFS